MKFSAIAILVAGVLVSGTALAAAQGRHDEDTNAQIRQLERRAEAVEQRYTGPGNRGAVGREEIARERREIRKMIERLESGGAVDSREMDRSR
jgi:hypothetical protein